MSFLDGLKDKAEEFGEKAREGFEAAKDKAVDLAGDVKDRFDGDDTPADEAEHAGLAAGDAADGFGEAVSAGTTAAAANADSGQDRYDEVLEAAQDKAAARQAGSDQQADPDFQGEAQLQVDAALEADPDLQGDPDVSVDLGDPRV